MKKSLFTILVATMAVWPLAGHAEVVWSEDFDGFAAGTGDLVVNANPVFGGASPDVFTNQWAVGSSGANQVSVVDKGGGDNALSLDTTGVGLAAAVWLDAGALGLSVGRSYDMQFTIANYAEDETAGPAIQFANVIKAKGIKGDPEGDATVTWDLLRAANWDNTVATNGAEIAAADGYVTSLRPPDSGHTEFSTNGTYTHAFTVTADDDFIGLIIGNKDQTSTAAGASVAFEITEVSIHQESATYNLTIEPVTGMVAIAASNLMDDAYYQLQGSEELSVGNWTNIGSSFSGVTEAGWMLPATNGSGFFKMGGSVPATFSVDDYYEVADGADDGPSVRRAVAAAQAHTASDPLFSARVLFTSNKVYQLEERTDVNPQIELYEAERMVLEGNNAMLVSYINNNHFSLWRCRDVTIRGFRLTLDPLPFTQGTLIDVDAVTGRWDMQLDAGYAIPPLGTFLTGAGADNVTFYGPDDQHLHAWLNVVTGEQLSTNTFRFVAETNDFSVLNDVSIGDRCAVKTISDYPVSGLAGRRVLTPDGEWMSSGAGNIELRKCDDILIQQVDSYASKSQTYHIFGCSNVTFDQAGYRPQPGTGNLLASNKGGLILRSNPGPMWVTNCYLESAADDLINASDHPFDSISVLATNVIEIEENMMAMDQSVGWNLLIMDPDTPALKGTCRVDSVVKLDGKNFELTLDQIEFETGYSALSSNDWIYVERHGPVTVTDCTLVNNLKKGIISRGPMVVSGCLFSNLNYGIHHYYQGSDSNGEGPHAYGLEAVSNRFVDCTTGGVVLFSSGVSSFNVDQQNVVSGNVFEQSADGEGIFARRMNGLTIENNTFTFDPSVPGDRQAIELVTCTNTTVSGNTGDRL